MMNTHRPHLPIAQYFFSAGRENLKLNQRRFGAGNFGKIRPDNIVEQMAMDIFNDPPAAADHQWSFPFRIIKIIRKKHDVAHMIQMGVRYKNVIDAELFFQ